MAHPPTVVREVGVWEGGGGGGVCREERHSHEGTGLRGSSTLIVINTITGHTASGSNFGGGGGDKG